MTTVEEIIDRAADVVYDLHTLADALLAWRLRPVRLRVIINGQEKDGLMIPIPDDQPFSVHVVFADKYDDPTKEPGPTQITVSNPGLATIGPHPDHASDDTWAQGTPTVGTGAFVVNVVSGTLTGASDELDIQPGTASQAHVEINVA